MHANAMFISLLYILFHNVVEYFLFSSFESEVAIRTPLPRGWSQEVPRVSAEFASQNHEPAK
jgi:hypothetical protein